MSILDLLEHDHDTIAQLARAADCDDDAVRVPAIEQLLQMLAHHAQIDHALLADALAGVEDSQAEIAQCKHDEAQMRAMVPQLQAGPATARPALRQLQTLMAAHAVRETESLFPLAERLLGDRRLEQLFYEAERRKHHQSENDGLIFPANRFGIE